MAVSKVILNGTTLIDTTQKTVTSASMLSGTTALKNDGTDITGSIASKTSSDLTASGATVTAPAGYYASSASKSVASGSATTPATTITANPTISVDSNGLISATVSTTKSITPTVSAGYVSSGTAGTATVSGSATSQLTAQAAQTIHPSTTDQTIASGKYLTGTQTVKGVLLTNLSAGNIKKDVVVKVGDSTDDDCVTSVTGTYEGGGNISVESLSVTQNGTYTAPTGKAYSPVSVNVSGGGGSVEAKDVNFIDYDGTILHSYTKTEFANLSALPANPSHTGLTAQGWNWTKAEITAQLTAMPNDPVWVGQMYVTTSGATEIDIVLDDINYLSPYLAIAVKGTCSVDWGDNSATDTMTGTSESTVKYQGHTYASTGSYTISIASSSGTIAFYSTSNGYPSVLLAVDGSNNKKYCVVYANAISAVRLGSNASVKNYAFCRLYNCKTITIPSGVTSIGQSAFYYCYSLSSLTIPSGVTSIDNFTFQNCYSLSSLTIPSGVTSIGQSAFNSCYTFTSLTIPSGVTSIGNSVFSSCYTLTSLTIPSGVTSIGNSVFNSCHTFTSLTIPSGVTSIGQSAFHYCYSLSSLTIPSGVTSIGNTAFSSCYSMEEYHFQRTTPPTLGTTAFSSIQSYTKIYVPYSADHSVLEAYKTATNWSTYASYMEEEPT